MSDWWTASLRAQRQLLDAQRRSLGAADALVAMQEAGKRATEANMAAFDAWAKLWGLGR